MFLKLSVLLSILLMFILTSCSPEHSKIVLAEYGDRQITMGEFENVYAKNVGGIEKAKEDSLERMRSFLELYTNFKMKLRDAEVRGYENDTALKDELLDYKKKVGVTYILEKELVEPGIKDLFNKRKLELRVSHLMIRPDSTGMEGAQKTAQAILDSIKNGADFVAMVKTHSHDAYSKPGGGDIFYITGGQLPFEFEDASYKTNVGEVYPEVVMTKYGAHIIKVTEKKERIPKIKASHILVAFQNESGPVDTSAAKAKVDSILAQIKNGADFAELAAQYSDDPGSKSKGGDLGYFERRMMVKEFDEAAFNLQVGEVSDIVRTNYGFHIIKITDRQQPPTYEEDKEELKKIFKQTRYQTEYDSLVSSLKYKYNFSVNETTLNQIAGYSDTLKVGTDNPNFPQFKESVLYTFANQSVTAGNFYEKMSTTTEFVNKQINIDLLRNAINKISADDVLEEEALNLEKRDFAFASLMDDYQNGIYIFKLQEDEVWNKIEIDSVKLKEFYEATKENYIWQDRVDFSEIFSRKDSLANYYYALLQAGENFDSAAVKYTERPGFKEKAGNFGMHDTKSTQQAVAADNLKNPGDYSAPFQTPGGWSIVKLNSKESSRIKTFEEAKAEVSGAFQESESKRLEKEYVESLTKRYQPQIHYDELTKAFIEK